MKKVLNFLIRKKWLILILIISGLLVYRFVVPQDSQQQELEEHIVQKGTVSTLVSSTGDIQASTSQDLTFGLQGRIVELKFKAGDSVNKGDYIGSLDTTSLQAQIKIAQGGLQSATANYTNTKQSLDPNIQSVTNQVTELDKQIAESNYESNLQINKNAVDRAEIDIEIAEEGLDASEESLDYLEEEQDKSEEVSDANIELAEETSEESEDVAEAQKELSQHQYDARVEDSERGLEVQELQKDQKEIDFDTAKVNTTNSDFLNAIGIEKADKQIELGDLRKQQAEITKRNTLSSLSGQISNAQGNLELAQYNLNQARLYAPFSGTILKMPFKVGEFFMGPQSTEVIQIGDLSRFIVEADINELDILNIGVGQKVSVEFEADPEISYEGKVEKINPAPIIDTSGVVNYKVEISLPSDMENVYPGLSVNVEIVTEEKTDIIQVPFVAIQRKEDGQYVRVKGPDGTIRDRKVETGIQSINNVEIVSGLEEGEIIVY